MPKITRLYKLTVVHPFDKIIIKNRVKNEKRVIVR